MNEWMNDCLKAQWHTKASFAIVKNNNRAISKHIHKTINRFRLQVVHKRLFQKKLNSLTIS